MLKLMRAPAKYLQDPDTLLHFCQETEYLGKNFLFLSAFPDCHAKIEKSFAGHDDCKRIYVDFGGLACWAEVDRLRAIVKESKIDCIVGIGGGQAIDTAKTAAHKEGLPVVIVPTIAATDAPCTGLAVMYNNDASFDQYIFFPKNPEVVIVDSLIVGQAPVKYLVSGMGDALGTYFEARHCFKAKAPSLENGGILHSGMALCEKCYEVLIENGYNAKIACEQKLLTPALEAIIECNIYLSGVGADNGGLNVAHSVYNGFTALEECHGAMHGRLVGFGTIVQLILENAPTEELADVIRFSISVGLPVTLAEVGVTDKSRVMIGCEKACVPGESIHNFIGDVTPRQLHDAVLVADELGKQFLAEE